MPSIQMENEMLRIVVLPGLGGKIASIYRKDLQFEAAAQNEKGIYDLPARGADFSKYDASGCDDAFPSVDRGEIHYGGKHFLYPDHGDIWTAGMEYSVEDDGIRLKCKGDPLPYSYEKFLTLKDSSVTIHYEVRNTSEYKFPCMWTFHGLFKYEEDMEIIYPEGVKRFLNVLDSPELGVKNECLDLENSRYDFCKVPPPASKTMLKYYVSGKVKEGRCGYRYHKSKIECILEYDAEKLPYLGMWITAGGYRGDHNCALEPSTSFYDEVSYALENESIHILDKKSPLTFDMKISVEKML